MLSSSTGDSSVLRTSKLNPEAQEFIPTAFISLSHNSSATLAGGNSCGNISSVHSINRLNTLASHGSKCCKTNIDGINIDINTVVQSVSAEKSEKPELTKCSSTCTSSSKSSPPSSSSSSSSFSSPPLSFNCNTGDGDEPDDVPLDDGEISQLDSNSFGRNEWAEDSLLQSEIPPSNTITTNNTVSSPLQSDIQQGTTYAAVTRGDLALNDNRMIPLCPFGRVSDHCPQAESCAYLHGDKCDFCNCLCLHPFDSEQRNVHRDECIREHEREMEQAFAIQRSSDKACGICMDIILDKELPVERRFGILEKCDHVFCLTCIRKWRQTEQLDKKTIRSCPECRVFSAFVIPSQYWYDSGEEKDKLIAEYKKALSQKPCKYFKQGQGQCPFAGACFYLHAYPDGRKADMPPPTTRRRENNSSLSTTRDVFFWNYFEVRDDHEFFTINRLEFFEDLEEVLRFQDLLRSSDTEDESDFG